MKRGIHWRNVRETADDAFDIAKHFDAFVILSNAGPELPRLLRHSFPGSLVIVRLYWPAGKLPEMSEVLGVAYEYLRQSADETGRITHLQLLNEPDIEYVDVTPEAFARWFTVVRESLHNFRPRLQVGFPMPSVKGQESWDYALRCREGIQTSDFISEHCYWQEDWQMDDWNWGARYYRCHQEWPDKAIHITEFGSSAEIDGLTKAAQYSHYLREMPEYVGSANAFLLNGTADWHRFSVTEQMAYVMTFGQGIGQPVPGKPAESSLSDSHDGGIMSEADRNRLWADYEAFPAFERFRADHPELGDELEDHERDYGAYRVRFYAGGVIGCRVGNWDNIAIWRSKEDLPDFT